MVTAPSPQADTAFLGKYPGERCQFYCRQHWIRLLWPAMRLLVWSAAIIAALWMTTATLPVEDGARRMIILFLASVWAFSHLMFLACFYRYFLYVIVVTNRRIYRIKRTLFTHDDHQSIDLHMLQDVNKCQRGPIQILFGFGTLILEAQDTALRIHFVPNIADKYARILRTKEAEHIRGFLPKHLYGPHREREAPAPQSQPSMHL
jgi:hypothetical protein